MKSEHDGLEVEAEGTTMGSVSEDGLCHSTLKKVRAGVTEGTGGIFSPGRERVKDRKNQRKRKMKAGHSLPPSFERGRG